MSNDKIILIIYGSHILQETRTMEHQDKEPNINDKPLFSEPTDEGIRKHHSTEHHKMRLFNHSISAQQNE